MKKKRIYMGCIAGLVIATGVFIGQRELFNDYFSPVKLQFISGYLKSNYLYDVDENKGLEQVYAGFLSGTDNSVTYYLEEGDFKRAQLEDAGNYFGTGISMMWSMDGQSFHVTRVMAGSPAQRAGIAAGDKITKINDIQALLANSQQLTEEAFSTKEEAIRYTVIHEGKEEEKALIPEKVEMQDIETKTINGALYIKLLTIKDGTSNEIDQLLQKAEEAGSKGVILDIRDMYTNNVEEINKICDLFVDQGTLFKVKTKKDNMQTYTAHEGAYKLPLCLLINTNTKAAAEAMVLGLKDNAFTIGSDTGGLMYLRKLVSLQDGSGMSVANGIIYDQYGNQLPKEGITPEERVYIGEEEKQELVENGIISIDNDSFIKAALRHFS